MPTGLRLALSWLTVLPIHVEAVGRKEARAAIAVAPLAGVLLGGAAAGLLVGAHAIGMPALLGGLLPVAFLAVATRGMHLDGLADTVDGLGCYGPPERALAVMKDGGAGPFAVVALIISLGAQAVAFAALTPDRWGAVVLAVALGRVAFTAACVRGVPPARPDGLGALVAGTQPPWVPIAWLVVSLAVSVFVAPLGPVAVVAAAVAVVVLVRHTRRRFGGVTGDVLGAACEIATTTALVVSTIR